MNEEILKRLDDYRPKFLPNNIVDYNDIIVGIIDNDKRFWKYEIPTLHRNIYFALNQLLDILNLERSQKYHKIQYEWADLFSMSFGYMTQFGNPYEILKYRLGLNHKVKGEKNIVEKYESRYNKYGEITIQMLKDILEVHNNENYFQKMVEKTV